MGRSIGELRPISKGLFSDKLTAVFANRTAFRFGWMVVFLLQTETPPIQISSPAGGQAVRGQVEILGRAFAEDFSAYNLSFAYTSDQTGAWFLIAESTTPVEDGLLAVWDTFSISDGDYNLRLEVLLEDGGSLISETTGIRVRNYSPVGTDTPAPTPLPSSAPSATPFRTPETAETISRPTGTPLPPNPAELGDGRILNTALRGAAAAFVVFLVLGLYSTWRRSRGMG